MEQSRSVYPLLGSLARRCRYLLVQWSSLGTIHSDLHYISRKWLTFLN